MSRRPPKPAPVIVKRAPEERRKLPPELEAFARSDDEKLRIRRPRNDSGRVRDPREGYTVAGVANRDARTVYDVRAEHMRALWADGAASDEALAELGQLLHEALRLELWRARRLTDFAAFAEEVVGVPAARARSLAEAYAERSGESLQPLTERAVALWLRTEAGLFEGDTSARARIRTSAAGPILELSVSLPHASTALAGVGARHLPLARAPERAHERGPERREREHTREHDRDEHTREHDRDEHTREHDRDERRSEERSYAARPPAVDVAAPETIEEHGTLAADEVDVASDENVDSEAPVLLDPSPAEREGRPVLGGARLLTRKPRDQGEAWDRSREQEAGAPRDRGFRDSNQNEPRSGFARGPRPSERAPFGFARNPRDDDRPPRGEGAGRAEWGRRAAREDEPRRYEPRDRAARPDRDGRRDDRDAPSRFARDTRAAQNGRGDGGARGQREEGSDRGGFRRGERADRNPRFGGEREGRGFGDRRGSGDRGGFGDRRGSGDRGGFGDRRGSSDRGGFGDRRGSSDRGGFGDRRGGSGDRGGFGDRQGSRDRDQRGDRPRFGAADRGKAETRPRDRENPRFDRDDRRSGSGGRFERDAGRGFDKRPRPAFGGNAKGKGFGARKVMSRAQGNNEARGKRPDQRPDPKKTDRDDSE